MGNVSAQYSNLLARSHNPDLQHYFDYAAQGIEVEQDGLKELNFGEFLIEERVINRAQLFRALQMQDQHPGVRIGEAVAALGFAPTFEVEKLYRRFMQLHVVTVGV